MLHTIKSYHCASLLIIIFSAGLLVACGGGSSTPDNSAGGNTATSGSGPTSGSTAAAQAEKWLAVILDNPTGKYPAGTKVPLVCVKDGEVGLGGPADNCPVPHLHQDISIFDENGVSGPFSDPDAPACGHGKIGLFEKKDLTPQCPKLASAKPANEPLTLDITDPKSYSAIVLELFADDGTTETVDLKPHMNAGENIVYPAADPKYTRLALSTVYDLGFNSAAGVNQVKIKKMLFDTSALLKTQFRLRDYGSSSSKTTTQLTVNLDDFASGALYVGGRKSGPLSLMQGPNIFDVYIGATEAFALVLGYDIKWVAGTFKLVPNIASTIDANSSNLAEMKDSTLDDSSLSGISDYLKTQILVKGGGLYQSYFELPGASAGVRDFPTADLSAVGGLNALKSSFSYTDMMTNIKQSATYSYFFDMPGTFKPLQPSYLTPGEITTQDTANGFDITNNHSFSIAGIKAYNMELDAKTMDMANNTEYSWDWKLSTKLDLLKIKIPVAFPSQAIYAAGKFGTYTVPMLTGADMTKIGVKGSSDVDAALGHEFNDDSDSLNNLKGTYQVRLSMDF